MALKLLSTVFKQWPPDVRTSAPAFDLVAATRDDSVDETLGIGRGLYLDAAGDVKFTTANGTDVTLAGLATGVIHPISVRRVWSTGTTVAASKVFIAY